MPVVCALRSRTAILNKIISDLSREFPNDRRNTIMLQTHKKQNNQKQIPRRLVWLSLGDKKIGVLKTVRTD